jgi:quercetin dioxygenase-like cupin family protein
MLPNVLGVVRKKTESTLMRRALLLTSAVSFLSCAIAGAQEQKDVVKPETAKTLLQNEQVRVMEVSFKPGVKTSTVTQPNRFLYALTDGSLVFAPPGKTPYELSFKAGEAIWLPSQPMATENDSGKEVRALVVEFKAGARAAATSGGAKAGKGSRGKGKARGGRGKRRA